MGEKNVLLGGEVNIPEQERVDRRVDAVSARERAFGSFGSERLQEMERLYFRYVMKEIKESGDEALSQTKFSQTLIKEINERLGETVKVYKACGTPLDTMHKVSAWVEFPVKNSSGRNIFVTLDVYTYEENKRDKADVVFRQPDCGLDPDDTQNEAFVAVLQEVADKVIERFKQISGRKTLKKSSEPMGKPDWTNKTGKRVVDFSK